jgi:hypothetical protein
MENKTVERDRYLSFEGIQCNNNADQLIIMLESALNQGKGLSQWHTYFKTKRHQQKKFGHDNLHFIGNQMNPLYSYFKLCDELDAIELLYKIEQECC